MAPEPDPEAQRGSQILLAQETRKKKQKTEQPQAERIAEFRLDPKQLEFVKIDLKISPFLNTQPQRIVGDVYDGLVVIDKPEKDKKINILYKENDSLIKEPAKVLKDGFADCDEATRAAYLLIWESGVKHIIMVEMNWVEKTTEGEKRTGHSFIVLMPISENEKEAPLIYDITYHYKDHALDVRDGDLEAAVKEKYATDSANPNFRITFRSNINEVEAAHYEWIGKYYAEKGTQDWKKCEDAFGRAVSLVPTSFEYNWELAVSYEKQFRWKDALEQYKKCMTFEEGKSNPKVLAAAGVAYANTGDIEEAKKLLREALGHNPDEVLKKRIESRLNEMERR